MLLELNSNHEVPVEVPNCEHFYRATLLVLMLVIIIAVNARIYFTKKKIKTSIRLSFLILIICFLYIIQFGRCFISREFYPHIVSELGFVILTLGIIDYFRDLFKQKEEEIRKEIDEVEEEDSRKVINAIISSSYSFRTVKGIAAEKNLSEARVRQILEQLASHGLAEKKLNKNDVDVWRIINVE